MKTVKSMKTISNKRSFVTLNDLEMNDKFHDNRVNSVWNSEINTAYDLEYSEPAKTIRIKKGK